MVNPGLFYKSFREVRMGLLVFSLGVGAFELLAAYALPTQFAQVSGPLMQLEFVRHIISALVGVDVGQNLGPELLEVVAWVHPILLVLLWAFLIATCTRVPAGEVDRGSVDLLLGLPVARHELFTCELVMCVLAGVVLCSLTLAGNVLGASLADNERLSGPAHRAIVAINLFAMYVAAGGILWFVSCCSQRRGRAVATGLAVMLAMLLVNFLAPFFRPISQFSFLCLLEYYRPLPILRSGTVPWGNLVVLVAVGVVFWGAGAIVLSRRDIRTV